MKTLWTKWNSWNLIKRILCGLVIGTILALLVPGVSVISLLGSLFVAALKGLAPVLVFFLVMGALTSAGGNVNTMKRIIALYAISTLIAGLLAVAASFIFPVSVTLDGVDTSKGAGAPSGIADVLTNLLTSLTCNPVDALTNANYLGILAWAILLGLALRMASKHTKRVIDDIARAVQQVVAWVISFAPFGVCGLVYNAVSTSGLSIFAQYGALLAVLLGCMVIIALVTNPLIVAVATRINPYPLVMRCLKESAITAFFTRSSAANIPVNMQLCHSLGLDERTYSISIPLGSTVNMCGAAVTISIMAMTAAHTLGIQIDFPSALILCILSAVGAAGTSGVAGGSLMLIPLACSFLGISNDVAMQMVGIGFIIGVLQDATETALNSSSDALLTATAEYRERRAQGIPVYVPKRGEIPPEANFEIDKKTGKPIIDNAPAVEAHTEKETEKAIPAQGATK